MQAFANLVHSGTGPLTLAGKTLTLTGTLTNSGGSRSTTFFNLTKTVTSSDTL